jgi:glycosyltransferase involved in cell wall biosynthesis
MNIVCVGAFRLPNLDAAAPRVLNNAKALRAAGHDVSFISWGGAYRDSDLHDDGYHYVDGFKYVITDELDPKGSLWNKFKEKLRRGNKSLGILNSMRENTNVIIMYNADYSWTKKMINYCSKKNIKLVNDITEWYDNNELHLTDIIPNHINMTRTQRMVKNKIVISSFLSDYYKESNNLILPPLCDHAEAKWSQKVDDERVADFDGITLIYAGNPAKKDCVHTTINVVNRLAHEGQKIRFVILGTTRESYIERYSHQLESTELHQNILFLGRVSQDLIPAYYKKADFMVLLREPTRKNIAGFPTKFAESMSAGVPVIANITSDLYRYLIDGNTGFVVPNNDAESFYEVIKSKVLTLNAEEIQQLKSDILSVNWAFDFSNRVIAIKQFLENLR